MAETHFAARSAWQDIDASIYQDTDPFKAGVTVRLFDHAFAASVIGSPDQPEFMAFALGKRHQRDGYSILPIAPGHCFVEGAQQPDPSFWSKLFGEEVSVIDQSGSRASLQLSGPHVLDVLAKGLMIDCDPLAFPAGSGTVTLLGHLSVQVAVDEGPVFEISVMRSVAGDLWHWVETVANPYGLRVTF
jgi:heterotetrameric sarcosine oxidase gamma subunit